MIYKIDFQEMPRAYLSRDIWLVSILSLAMQVLRSAYLTRSSFIHKADALSA